MGTLEDNRVGQEDQPINNRIGLRDQPINKVEEEALGLIKYADVLSEFVKRCDTPITIALQGDWGSGKTSLMKLIKNQLDNCEADEPVAKEAEPYKTVWFNTWQYAQFEMSDRLAVSMMSKITDKLAANANADVLKTVKSGLWAATRAIAITSASLIGQADAAKDFFREVGRPFDKEVDADPAIALERVKDGLSKIVKTNVDNKVAKKVVVFIDDLDRLVPQRAVELLEALKIFLDIEGCVFMIACDYGVVAAGLKAKFGTEIDDLKGRSFFDKIIQLPFRMPTRRYAIDQYIEKLLTQIGVHFNASEDIDNYRDLVEHSVGFNPRMMKRLLNTLQLLMMLDEKDQNIGAISESIVDDDKERNRSDACRVMFGILCMMEEYEPLFDQIAQDVSEDNITELRDELKTGGDFEELRNCIGAQGVDEGHDEARVERAVRFMGVFVDCLQLDDKEALSDDEIGHLRKMLSLATIVSSGPVADSRDYLENFAINLKREIRRRYREFVNSRKYNKFESSDSEVSIQIYDDVELYLVRTESSYSMYLEVDEEQSKLGFEILRGLKKLGWEEKNKIPRDYEDWQAIEHVFVSVLASKPDALNTFKSQVWELLDRLTDPITRLSDLVDVALAASKGRKRTDAKRKAGRK